MKVTVAIPVGPHPSNQRWLMDAIKSACQPQVNEILLIDDMAHLDPLWEIGMMAEMGVKIWEAPWRLGVATAFNFGVALAKNEAVFLLGSDDWLEPDCIAECVKAYQSAGRPEEKYFAVGVRYSDNRKDKDQYTPCNAAMVTKALWRRCGGFPIETATGAPDAALISIFMKHTEQAGSWHIVNGNRPLYNYRVHEETDTAGRAPWQGIILGTRDLVIKLWKPPSWTKEENNELSRT